MCLLFYIFPLLPAPPSCRHNHRTTVKMSGHWSSRGVTTIPVRYPSRNSPEEYHPPSQSVLSHHLPGQSQASSGRYPPMQNVGSYVHYQPSPGHSPVPVSPTQYSPSSQSPRFSGQQSPRLPSAQMNAVHYSPQSPVHNSRFQYPASVHSGPGQYLPVHATVPKSPGSYSTIHPNTVPHSPSAHAARSPVLSSPADPPGLRTVVHHTPERSWEAYGGCAEVGGTLQALSLGEARADGGGACGEGMR